MANSVVGAGDHKNFLEAEGSLFKKSLLLDEDTLRKVGYDGPSFEPDVMEEDDGLGHILTPSQASDAKQCKFIIPDPGKCVKTKDKKSSEKVFINVCHSDKVPEPPIYFSEDQLCKILDGGADDDLDNIRFPMSIGEKRIDKDKSGTQCQVYDIIVNSTLYHEKIATSTLYWTFLCIVSMEALDDKYKLDLEKNDYIVMKHKASHGKPQPQFVRDKARIREIDSTDVGSSTSTKHSGKPLIQEIDDSKSGKPKPLHAKTVPKKIECEPRPPPAAKKNSHEPLIREVSTKIFKKAEDPTASLPELEIVVYRNKGSSLLGTATLTLHGLRKVDFPNIVMNCKRDVIEVISAVGKCHAKVPINIQSFYPRINFDTNVLTLHLKLCPMDKTLIQEWKNKKYELPELEAEAN